MATADRYGNLRDIGPEFGASVKNDTGGTLKVGTAIKLKAAVARAFEQATANTDDLLGVLPRNVPAGEWVGPMIAGTVRVRVAENVTAGDFLTPSTAGEFEVADSAERYHMQALTSANSNVDPDQGWVEARFCRGVMP